MFVTHVARINRNKFEPQLVPFLSKGFPGPDGDFSRFDLHDRVGVCLEIEPPLGVPSVSAV